LWTRASIGLNISNIGIVFFWLMAFKAINLLVSYSYTNNTKVDAEEVPMEFPMKWI
jgi:hypothetical protein